MRDSLKARMAAILVASGLLVAAPVVLVQGASAQTNNCVHTNLVGGIGNDSGNDSESESEASCEAEGTTISQSGDNTNVGVQVGNVGVALCGGGLFGGGGDGGTNVCPVVNGEVEQEQEQEAGHQADAYTGGNGKKAKKAKKKKAKKSKKRK